MFKRISNLVRGFLSLFISGIERKNPEALLEVEKENLRAQIAKYNQGLASHAGLCERLMTQVKRQEAEERDLRAKTSANLKAGNRKVAAQYAFRLQTLTRELADNREQLKQAEETYQNLIKARDVAISAARAKIEALKSSIDDMKMKQAMAELTEMSAGMVSTLGGSGDTLDRLQTMVEEEREKAAGRARVARDSMDMKSVALKEAEEAALADQALADFAASEGLAIQAEESAPAETAAPPQEKTMGPEQEKEPTA
ncbi:MAG TPA: PspA/IM30 family protein [Candidatus Brocadiia bacterium]|nr:PspA/IM30 family protein [Candidatus Brocadiia bacterium]